MSVGRIFLWIVISTIVIMLLILKFNINATIALCGGAIVLGIGGDVGLANTAVTLGNGFGNMMTSLGLPIGFGVILGELMSECGACRSIAQTLIRNAGKKYIYLAVAFAGYILSIPVFADIAFIILIPLCVEIARELDDPLPYSVGAATVGTACTAFLVPPTPAPLAIPDYFVDVNVGDMVFVGIIVAAVLAFITTIFYCKMLDHGFFDKKCYAGNPKLKLETVENSNSDTEKDPAFIVSLIPILIPVILLVMSTVTGAFGIENEIISFVSNRNIAMMAGAIAAYILATKNMSSKEIGDAATKSLSDAGTVMLITGAGGSFAAVIESTGLSSSLAETLSANGFASPVIILLISYGIGFIFRVSLGSGTMATITSSSIMGGVLATGEIGLAGIWCALACIAGSMSFPHINDSGFWVTTNMSGYTVKGGLKTYSTIHFMLSIQVLIIAIAGGFITSMF